MKRAVLIAFLAGCAQAQSVDTPDGSLTMSLTERAFVIRTLSEQQETINALRETLKRVYAATGCT